MTKIICPYPGCLKTDFLVRKACQAHVIAHLKRAHGITVTKNTLAEYRKQQDEVWQQEYNNVQAELIAVAKRHRQAWENFAKDPSVDIPQESYPEELLRREESIMDADDDDDDDEGSKAASQKTAPEQGSRGAQSKKNSEWFEQGGVSRGYDVSVRSTQTGMRDVPCPEAASRAKMQEMLGHYIAAERQQQNTSSVAGPSRSSPTASSDGVKREDMADIGNSESADVVMRDEVEDDGE